ncbi:hypothetical protein GGI43DRAFT_157302 [Trichoderma evansii]
MPLRPTFLFLLFQGMASSFLEATTPEFRPSTRNTEHTTRLRLTTAHHHPSSRRSRLPELRALRSGLLPSPA